MIKVNPLVKSGRARKNYNELSISPVEFGKAMIQLFDMWFFEKEYGISVNPLDLIIGNMITGIPFGCNFSKSCQNTFISIGPLGDVYPCRRFDGISRFKFGNINNGSLDTILASGVRRRLLARTTETTNECKTCNFRTICNAGCMHNAYTTGGDALQKDCYCAAYKMLFKHIKKALDFEIAIHQLAPNSIENPQLRRIVRQRCKGASGESHPDHAEWNDYAEHGDAYKDYSDNHVDHTQYSDHYDEYHD